ncbi:MAG: BTAD domain-containing putative transcriptional regulator [Cellulomonas sp.]
MLTVGVLGPVELRRDGVLVRVPSGRTTEVLVRLALEAGRVVSTDRLIDDLWGDDGGTSLNTLQSKVSQLRRALRDASLVSGRHGGYALEVDPGGVDALRVASLATSASAARRSGDAATAVALADEGLALYRAEVLVDAGEREWVHAQRARLESVRLNLLEVLFAARVDLGAGGDVAGELEPLVALHPLREGLWASLITALYRGGRQADALAAYSRVRALLVDELGVEPGPELQALEAQVLQQSPALHRSDPRPLADIPTNLPTMSSPFVGRAEQLATLTDLVEVERLVTVVGPAGVGKTRLALEVARRGHAPGGVWLVRLDAADASTSLPRLVAETLQLPGGEQALADRLAGAETVLLLDGCEHVVEAVAAVAGALLDAAPRLHVIATSQVPLGVDGEIVNHVEPLSLAESRTLFEVRATAIRGQFVLDADTTAVVEEVCHALDGLPLAIELAAARVRSLSVHEIARRLDDRFTLLQDPTSRQPERRRALSGAIAWSYDLLFPDDQRGLWALASFVDGAPLDATEVVLAALGVPEPTVVDVISRLADRSLVDVEVSDRGAVRYRLLDSIRAYALDRARDAGLLDVAAAAHAAWYAELADRCAATVRGSGQADCLTVVRAERANVDAALAWTATHDPLIGVRLVDGLAWTWVVLGDGVAGAERVRGALAAAEPVPPRDAAAGSLVAGWLEASAGNVDRAEADLLGALRLGDELADERLRADAERHLAFLRIQQGRPGEVVALAASSIATCRRLDRVWEVTAGLLLHAYGSIMLGDTATAAADAQEAVEHLSAIGDSWGQVHAEAMLGAIAQAEHRFDDAAGHLSRAAAASERLGFVGQASLHLASLGRVQQRGGDLVAASVTLERAIEAATAGGDLRLAATARLSLARLLRVTGDADAARALLEQTDRWYRSAGGGEGALLARCLLAAVDTPDAARLRGVLDDAARAGDAEAQVYAADALARLAAARGDRVAARELLRSADELAATAAHVLDPGDRVDAIEARAVLA